MLFCVRSVNLNFLCRFSVWWNLRILLSHSCWMFCTDYKNKVYLIHSAHVRAKRAEICFLASTLTSVNVGAILEIARGIKTQIRPAVKPDVLVTQRQHARASTRRFRVQTQERGTWKRDMTLLWHHFPRETGYGKLKKNIAICGYDEEKETQPNFYRGCHRHPTEKHTSLDHVTRAWFSKPLLLSGHPLSGRGTFEICLSLLKNHQPPPPPP